MNKPFHVEEEETQIMLGDGDQVLLFRKGNKGGMFVVIGEDAVVHRTKAAYIMIEEQEERLKKWLEKRKEVS
ncbi:MAG: hypothetical protein KKD30_18955 [Gammaproteobacteria bacterium]|nr:hypothetical protein [Gammaproteobacteria bacterium]